MSLKKFIETSHSCVFSLVNNVDKRVCIYQTSDFHHQLGFLISELNAGRGIEQMRLDIHKLDVEILGETNDPVMLRLWKHSFVDMYKEKGYSLYSNRKDMVLHVDYYIHRNGIVQVVLKCTRSSFVVGLFDTEEEAKGYIEYAYYNNKNRYNYPVFANNKRTREYMKRSPTAQVCMSRGLNFKVQDKVQRSEQSERVSV